MLSQTGHKPKYEMLVKDMVTQISHCLFEDKSKFVQKMKSRFLGCAMHKRVFTVWNESSLDYTTRDRFGEGMWECISPLAIFNNILNE